LEDRSLRRSIPDARRYLGIRLCAAVYPFERISRYGYPATALMSYCAERGAAVMPGIFIPARANFARFLQFVPRASALIEVSKYFYLSQHVDCFSPPSDSERLIESLR